MDFLEAEAFDGDVEDADEDEEEEEEEGEIDDKGGVTPDLTTPDQRKLMVDSDDDHEICQECGEPLLDGQRRYQHWPCHYDCGCAARSLTNKLRKLKGKNKSKSIQGFKTMKQSQRKKYNEVIKLLVKPKGGTITKKKRDGSTVAMAMQMVNTFVRTISMKKVKGCTLMTEEDFIVWKMPRLFEGTRKERLVLAKKDWHKRCDDPNSHTEYENGELVLATKDATKVQSEDKLAVSKVIPNAKKEDVAREMRKGFSDKALNVFSEQGGAIVKKAAFQQAQSIEDDDESDSSAESDQQEDEEGDEEDDDEGGDESVVPSSAEEGHAKSQKTKKADTLVSKQNNPSKLGTIFNHLVPINPKFRPVTFEPPFFVFGL